MEKLGNRQKNSKRKFFVGFTIYKFLYFVLTWKVAKNKN